jgi:hypothetical protein
MLALTEDERKRKKEEKNMGEEYLVQVIGLKDDARHYAPARSGLELHVHSPVEDVLARLEGGSLAVLINPEDAAAVAVGDAGAGDGGEHTAAVLAESAGCDLPAEGRISGTSCRV